MPARLLGQLQQASAIPLARYSKDSYDTICNTHGLSITGWQHHASARNCQQHHPASLWQPCTCGLQPRPQTSLEDHRVCHQGCTFPIICCPWLCPSDKHTATPRLQIVCCSIAFQSKG
jgi:hypothetical protein